MELPEMKETSAIWIENIIRDYVADSEDNSLKGNGDKAWEDALVGFSRGDDPLYSFFKSDIGSFFWTPEEIFSLSFPDTKVKVEELTVISWVLPQTESTKADNRRESSLPAERWVRSRNYGEDFSMKLARHVVSHLLDRGIQSLVPAQSPKWSWQESKKYGFASNWSERHAAYTSGLGTFGLCDGLITRKGKAMRCGSVIARIDVSPTERPYNEPHAYCLFYTKGTCRKCISRCPCGAITEDGHDKSKCKSYLFETVAPYAKSQFGIASYGCGLCQTGVPCESRIPMATDL
ncbi:MAG: Epoxyqueuosine reductase [Syntrophus sp. SKADARSKE-3]|nr:Epoxyqueuosine reductase [Syntrophus sp. SKADARSKE-3]